MNSSKIIRNCTTLECQNVVMANLDEIVESKAGSFVVLDSAKLSTMEATEAKPAKIAKAGSVPAAPQQEQLDSAAQEAELQAAFERGHQSAIDEADAQLRHATQALATACNEINGLKEKVLQRSSDDMLRLVLAIAERVVNAELSINPEVISRTVQQAIQAAVSAEEFRIKVNPDDLQVVQERKPLFVASLSGLSHIEFVADASVTRGGCLLESPLGRVDATIEAQLSAITKTLQQAIGID
ncbi:MAG: FliH/SctL family protein [Desulfuromonas sp.]|nr:FliH/SctL family protein [Desulfuromonas sp.]